MNTKFLARLGLTDDEEDELVSFTIVQAAAEAGTSAIVRAIANAIFAATGKRLRKMPVNASVLMKRSPAVAASRRSRARD